jgi:hypothetical protein
MLQTSNKLNRAWDVLITVSATLAALIISIRLVLGWQNRAGMVYVDVMVTLVFGIDIFLQFQRSRYAKQDQFIWEKRMSFDESNIVSALPPSLRTDVSLFLKRDIIEKVPLFQGASDEFIREIALQMTPVIFTPGDYVYKAGESGRDMYFITQGTVEMFQRRRRWFMPRSPMVISSERLLWFSANRAPPASAP